MNDFVRHNDYIEWKKQAKWCDFLRYKIMDVKQQITYLKNLDDDWLEDGFHINNIIRQNELIRELKDLRNKIKIEEKKCKDLKNEYRRPIRI